MNMAIENVIALAIFLLIIIILVALAFIPSNIAVRTNYQQELRSCCRIYVANGCPSYEINECFGGSCTEISNIICSQNEDGTKSLEDLVEKNSMSYESLKTFCGCP